MVENGQVEICSVPSILGAAVVCGYFVCCNIESVASVKGYVFVLWRVVNGILA